MSQASLLGEIKEAIAPLFDMVKEVASLGGNTRDFNDIKKKARENELTVYALASENVSSDMYTRLATGIEVEITSAIQAILSATIAYDAKLAHKFIQNNFTNNHDLLTQVKNGVRNVGDSLGENIDIELKDIKITFSESNDKPTKKVFKAKDVNRAFDNASTDHPVATGSEIAKTAIHDVATSNARHGQYVSDFSNVNDRDALKVQGNYHTVKINYTDERGQVLTFTITLFIRVRLMAIESSKLIDAIVSSRNRSNFYSYLRWRAGASSFFKGFILNLTEIEKQIKRDTSKDLSERILGSLLSKSGFTRAKAFGDITELKNFVLVISKEDSDRLITDHNLNLSKPATLTQLFKNMNILSLMIVDETKMRVTVYESDNPTEMTVLSTADLNDATRLARLFQSVNR